MRHESDAGSLPVPGPLDDLLTGSGCLTFDEGDTQVHVGWLQTGGDGLVVTARVDEGVIGQVRFWCDAQQWCDWLAPSLPVPSWDALPPDWHASAASLTLATGCASGSLSDGTSNDPVPEAWPDNAGTAVWPCATALSQERVATTWRIGLVMQRNGRQLALTYLDGASAWLRRRCEQATPCDAPLDPAGWPERRCTLVAGWVSLPATQCEDLRTGDAVLLDMAADIARGEYWLVDGDHAIAMRDGQPSGRHVLQCENPGVAQWYAVVAERRFPIPLLMAWRSGVPVPLHPSTTPRALHAGRITLRCAGFPPAGGRLLRFEDGRVAVHIEGRTDAVIGSGMTDGDDPSDDISGGDPMGVHSAPT